jgi:hypothetical protein
MLLRVLVVCLLWSAGAHAGGTDPVLRYRCDPTHDQIVLTYRMESSNDNQTFPVGPDAWTPGQLIEGHGGRGPYR